MRVVVSNSFFIIASATAAPSTVRDIFIMFEPIKILVILERLKGLTKTTNYKRVGVK
jgi:hypothetical protein